MGFCLLKKAIWFTALSIGFFVPGGQIHANTAHEGGSFEKNHYRFIAEQLRELLGGETGKVLLIGSFGSTRDMLSMQYPLIDFEGFCVWNGCSWDQAVRKKNFSSPFDCIVAMHVLERQPDRGKVLQVISDLLRPGGKILMYLDPSEVDSLDQRIETYVKHAKLEDEYIPIIPSPSIQEYQMIIESMGLHVLDQSTAQYKIYYPSDLSALLGISDFICSRWPVPWVCAEDRAFVREIRNRLKGKRERIKVPELPTEYNYWIEDILQTYYFIIQK